jgi:hypothetical protein
MTGSLATGTAVLFAVWMVSCAARAQSTPGVQTLPPGLPTPPPGLGPAPPPAALTPYPPARSTREARRTAIYGDLLGRGLAYAVGFDYLVTPYLGLGTCLSYLDPAAFFVPYLNVYPVGGRRSALVLSVGLQFVHIGDAQNELLSELLWDGVEGMDYGGQVAVGYEFRSAFLFRVMALGMFNKNGIIPWPGLTFGASF